MCILSPSRTFANSCQVKTFSPVRSQDRRNLLCSVTTHCPSELSQDAKELLVPRNWCLQGSLPPPRLGCQVKAMPNYMFRTWMDLCGWILTMGISFHPSWQYGGILIFYQLSILLIWWLKIYRMELILCCVGWFPIWPVNPPRFCCSSCYKW